MFGLKDIDGYIIEEAYNTNTIASIITICNSMSFS